MVVKCTVAYIRTREYVITCTIILFRVAYSQHNENDSMHTLIDKNNHI